MLLLTDLIEDVLLHVFSYFDPADLYAVLCLNVDRLTTLVNFSIKGRIPTLLITGSDCFARTNPIKCVKDRLRIHSNWIYGNFQPSAIFDKSELKDVRRLRMDDRKHLFISNGGEILKYERLESGSVGDEIEKFGEPGDPVISHMILKGRDLFTGTESGTCTYIQDGRMLIDNQKIHYEHYKDVLAMDYCPTKNILATSNQQEINIFSVGAQSIDLVGQTHWRAGCLLMDSYADQLLVANICLSDYLWAHHNPKCSGHL